MTTDNFPDVFHQPGAATPFATQDLTAMKALLDQINASAGAASKSLSSGFSGASTQGKSLDAVLTKLATSLAKLALKQGAQTLGQGISSGLGALFSNVFGENGGGGASVAPFADGGVVASPTYFASGGGLGLMGERGAEAIMPLARGPDGRLGVAAQATPGAAAVTVNISTPDVDGFRRAEAQISGALARAVGRGQRSL